MSIRKPASIHARWNKDLTITLYCRGRKIYRTRKGRIESPKDIQPFLDGWFGENPQIVRWTYA